MGKWLLIHAGIKVESCFFKENTELIGTAWFSLLGIEFGAPHGGMKLVNIDGSCDGLVPDGNSPMFDFILIQNVYLSLSSLIIYSFGHLLVSLTILHWSNVYVLVSSLFIF